MKAHSIIYLLSQSFRKSAEVSSVTRPKGGEIAVTNGGSSIYSSIRYCGGVEIGRGGLLLISNKILNFPNCISCEVILSAYA